jgi:hypothetical protein
MAPMAGSVTDFEDYEDFFRQGEDPVPGAGRQMESLAPVAMDDVPPLSEEELLRAARFRKPVTVLVSSLLVAFLLALAARDRQPQFEAVAASQPLVAAPASASMPVANSEPRAIDPNGPGAASSPVMVTVAPKSVLAPVAKRHAHAASSTATTGQASVLKSMPSAPRVAPPALARFADAPR